MLHYLQGLFSALDFGSLLAALVRAAAVTGVPGGP